MNMSNTPRKPKRKNSLWERKQDLLQRLVDNPKFQERVSAVRAKWGIPPSGYDEPSPAWDEKLGQLDDDYYREQWPSDLKEMKEAEEKALKKEIGWLVYEDLKVEVNYRRPINNFFQDLDLIIEDFKVSPTWRDNLRIYVLYGQTSSAWTPSGISFTMPMGRDFPDTITITIDAHTTKQDMLDRWPDIERAQKRLKHATYDVYQPYPSYERHKVLHDLKASGMSLKDISEKTGVPYHYINNYINRYLKHINNK